MDRAVIRVFDTTYRRFSTAGFTLVELMVALAVGSIVMAAVMTAFQAQHNTYLAQGQVVEMQQNARVALDMLELDIRSAGNDPNNLGAGITTVGIDPVTGVASTLTFTRDNGGEDTNRNGVLDVGEDTNGNGVLDAGVLETISYGLVDAFSTEGRNDWVVDDLGRNEGGGPQPVAENISRLEFRYLDGNGNPTAVLNNIRSIQVSILVQSARPEAQSNPGRDIYTTPSGAQWQAPVGFWNLYLTTAVYCRNLGL